MTTYTIGTYNSTTKKVPVTFTLNGNSYVRNITAVLDNNSTYDAALTNAYVLKLVSGPVFASDLASINTVAGSLANSAWVKLPSIYRIVVGGTGTITLNTIDFNGNVVTGVVSYTTTGTILQEFYYFGINIQYVQATLTGSATASIV